ncbi:MAG: SPOR domain-containing protein, partial [Alphaproteobacteria bacterium]|nr:SPOR domain-containing protein [Alphaproteobacteria bacterium]
TPTSAPATEPARYEVPGPLTVTSPAPSSASAESAQPQVADAAPVVAPSPVAEETKGTPVVEPLPAAHMLHPVRVAAAAPLIHAVHTPAKHFVVEHAHPVRIAAKAHRHSVATHHPVLAMVRHKFSTGRFAVQIGAFNSDAVAHAIWQRDLNHVALLRSYDPAESQVRHGRVNYYRLAVTGFGSRAEAMHVCATLRMRGSGCFVRTVAGDQLASWLRHDAPVKMAAHKPAHQPVKVAAKTPLHQAVAKVQAKVKVARALAATKAPVKVAAR